MKVCFETFGCRLNKAEALQMEAEYRAKGWERTERHSDADLFVVRGCSVTARAQEECEKLIAHLKRHYPVVPIRICGCLKADATSASRQHDRALLPDQRSGNAAQTPLPTRTARAYLKVQDGCSGACTFCIVPKFRGKSVSEPFTELTDKTRRFIDAGYREIVITGCNLALYASEGKRLPDLVSALAELGSSHSSGEDTASPICRFRIGSLEPGKCALETVQAMAEHANVCRFLHIPIQSGSDRILLAMKRPYRMDDVEELIGLSVKRMPGLGLGCDLMTGFPGESILDYTATKGLLKRFPFNNAHIFPYSKRPGTVAAALNGSVEKIIRSGRAHELAHLIKPLREKFAKSFIGKTVEIIVEDEKKVVGWTGEYLKCEAVGSAPRKSRVKVFVTRVKDDRLSGRLA